jgi:hypothetical protein
MMYVFVFPVEGFDRETANNRLIEASLKKDGVKKYMLNDFIEAINDDCVGFNCHWVRLFDDNDGYFPISYLHKDDLEHKGFDVSNVSESDLSTIADKMNDDYCDWMFWDSLDVIAGICGIPKKGEKTGDGDDGE